MVFRWALKGLLVSLCILSLVFLVAEIGLRTIRVFRPARATYHPELGWVSTPNVRRCFTGKRIDGSTYDVDFRTAEYGFREWGSLSIGKKRLLVVGDSYTDAHQVSNHDTYYSQLHRKLGDEWELFAYGLGGYGTLQEYMVISNYWSLIKPDLVIWQWCVNDLCNNSFEMDSRTFVDFNVMPRPFLENGTIRMRCPHELPVLSWHSALWRYAVPRIAQRLLANKTHMVDIRDTNAPHFLRAATITDRITAMARTMVGDTPVVIFVVGGSAYNEFLTDLAARYGLFTIGGVHEKLSSARTAGIVVDAHSSIGGHWSPEGHSAIAELLYDNLVSMSLCDNTQTRQ